MAEKKKLRSYKLIVLREGLTVPKPEHFDPEKVLYPSGQCTRTVRAQVARPTGEAVQVAAIVRDPDGLGVTVLSERGSFEIPLADIAYGVPAEE